MLLTDGRQFKARREIILSAGTIRTPQILMLSGIGPGPLFLQYNIPVIFDNPEVGKNFFDHFALFQVWRLRHPEKGLSMGSPNCDDQVFNKGSPCDWAVNEGTPPSLLRPASNADVKSGRETDQSLLHPERCFTETMVLYGLVGAPVPADGTFVTTSVMLLLPTSRGSLYIDMRIRMTGLSHVHSAGTAAMGKVIDSQLRVRGVKVLRIADASIFPAAIGGHLYCMVWQNRRPIS